LLGDSRVVRDHHNRLPVLIDQFPQDGRDPLAVRGIEVAGRLIGQQDGRFDDQGPGDGNPLLLATGEFAGEVRPARGQADQFQRSSGPFAGLCCGQAIQLQRQRDILFRC
jgi:hypothetical protein